MEPRILVLLQDRKQGIPRPRAHLEESRGGRIGGAGGGEQGKLLAEPFPILEEVDCIVRVELIPKLVRVRVEALLVEGGDGVGFLRGELRRHMCEVGRVGGRVVPGVVVPDGVGVGKQPLAEGEGGDDFGVCAGAVAGFEGGAGGGGEWGCVGVWRGALRGRLPGLFVFYP